MKVAFVIFIYLVLILVCAAKSNVAACDADFYNEDVVLIPFVFEFGNQQARSSWIYESIYPRLRMPAKPDPYFPSDSQVKDGRLNTNFCVKPVDIPPQNSEFELAFGPRSLKIRVRPIAWSTKVNWWGKTVRLGAMATISVLNQPDPDWVIVRRAVWMENSKGLPRIEVELHNLSTNVNPGVPLALAASYAESCISGPGKSREEEIELHLSIKKGQVDLATRDPGFRI